MSSSSLDQVHFPAVKQLGDHYMWTTVKECPASHSQARIKPNPLTLSKTLTTKPTLPVSIRPKPEPRPKFELPASHQAFSACNAALGQSSIQQQPATAVTGLDHHAVSSLSAFSSTSAFREISATPAENTKPAEDLYSTANKLPTLPLLLNAPASDLREGFHSFPSKTKCVANPPSQTAIIDSSQHLRGQVQQQQPQSLQLNLQGKVSSKHIPEWLSSGLHTIQSDHSLHARCQPDHQNPQRFRLKPNKTAMQRKADHATREKNRVRERRKYLDKLISIVPALQRATESTIPGERKHLLSTVEILRATYEYVVEIHPDGDGRLSVSTTGEQADSSGLPCTDEIQQECVSVSSASTMRRRSGDSRTGASSAGQIASSPVSNDSGSNGATAFHSGFHVPVNGIGVRNQDSALTHSPRETGNQEGLSSHCSPNLPDVACNVEMALNSPGSENWLTDLYDWTVDAPFRDVAAVDMDSASPDLDLASLFRHEVPVYPPLGPPEDPSAFGLSSPECYAPSSGESSRGSSVLPHVKTEDYRISPQHGQFSRYSWLHGDGAHVQENDLDGAIHCECPDQQHAV